MADRGGDGSVTGIALAQELAADKVAAAGAAGAADSNAKASTTADDTGRLPNAGDPEAGTLEKKRKKKRKKKKKKKVVSREEEVEEDGTTSTAPALQLGGGGGRRRAGDHPRHQGRGSPALHPRPPAPAGSPPMPRTTLPPSRTHPGRNRKAAGHPRSCPRPCHPAGVGNERGSYPGPPPSRACLLTKSRPVELES